MADMSRNWRSWTIIPFTFGEVVQLRPSTSLDQASPRNHGISTEESEITDARTDQIVTPITAADQNNGVIVEFSSFNGLVSSMQMFIILIAISSSMTISALLSDNRDRFVSTANLVTLIIFMAIGLVVGVLFKTNQRNVFYADHNEREPKKRLEQHSLTLIGLLVFYIFGFVRDVFYIVTVMSCNSVWESCMLEGRSFIYVSYVVTVVFLCMRIIYLGATTLFCIAFNNSTFIDNVSNRYGLMFIQAVNISLWFDALIHESIENARGSTDFSDNIEQGCFGNSSNVSKFVEECLSHNSTFYNEVENIVSPIFFPFTIEFTLLAGECFGFWFFHCKSTPPFVNEQINSSEMEQSQLLAEVDENDLMSETSLLLQNTTRDSLFRTLVKHSCAKIWLMTVVVINILLCVFSILLKFKLPYNEVNHLKKISVCYLFSFWIFMTIAVAFGYHVSRSFRLKSNMIKFSSMDYILLFTSFGPLSYNILTSIAVVGISITNKSNQTASFEEVYDFTNKCNQTASFEEVYDFTPQFFISLQLLNAVHVYFQVTFSLYAGRIIIDKRQGTAGYKPIVFKGIVLYLAICNGALWLSGTFGGYEFGGIKNCKNGNSLQAKFFTKNGWAVISKIVVPLLLFFRFNSCILFIQVLLA